MNTDCLIETHIVALGDLGLVLRSDSPPLGPHCGFHGSAVDSSWLTAGRGVTATPPAAKDTFPTHALLWKLAGLTFQVRNK